MAPSSTKSSSISHNSCPISMAWPTALSSVHGDELGRLPCHPHLLSFRSQLYIECEKVLHAKVADSDKFAAGAKEFYKAWREAYSPGAPPSSLFGAGDEALFCPDTDSTPYLHAYWSHLPDHYRQLGYLLLVMSTSTGEKVHHSQTRTLFRTVVFNKKVRACLLHLR